MFAILVGYLILQRLTELFVSERNRRWALAQGGREFSGAHHREILSVHVLFYFALVLEWRYLSRGWSPVWALWLGLLVAAQLLRLWSVRALGRRWNTRILVIPGMAPVTSGPYRFVRHPNYSAVVVEMAVIPLLCGAYLTAAVFSIANFLLLARRIPEEERAVQEAGGVALPDVPRLFPLLIRRHRPEPGSGL